MTSSRVVICDSVLKTQDVTLQDYRHWRTIVAISWKQHQDTFRHWCIHFSALWAIPLLLTRMCCSIDNRLAAATKMTNWLQQQHRQRQHHSDNIACSPRWLLRSFFGGTARGVHVSAVQTWAFLRELRQNCGEYGSGLSRLPGWHHHGYEGVLVAALYQ